MQVARLSMPSVPLIGWLLFGFPAYAGDLSGAWATDVSACKQIFVKRGDAISIAEDSDVYGTGFILEQNRIRGKIASCKISSRKEDGPITHLVANCSTDIALQTVQFSLRRDGEDKITRLFPGLPELSTTYFRCP